MKLEVHTPARTLAQTTVSWVQVPSSLGEVGILPQHAPMISNLGSGVLSYQEEGKVLHLAVHHGQLEVGPEKVVVLAEKAEHPDALNLAKEEEAEKKTKEELATQKALPLDALEAQSLSLEWIQTKILLLKKTGKKKA